MHFQFDGNRVRSLRCASCAARFYAVTLSAWLRTLLLPNCTNQTLLSWVIAGAADAKEMAVKFLGKLRSMRRSTFGAGCPVLVQLLGLWGHAQVCGFGTCVFLQLSNSSHQRLYKSLLWSKPNANDRYT